MAVHTATETEASRQTVLRFLEVFSTGDVDATELNNGRIYNNLYHFLFVVRDGKVLQVKEYLDTMHTNDVFFG